MSYYPKTLIISNECISQMTSNGRTLGLYFQNWPQDKLAQFCIKFTAPDYNICNNYYVITDENAKKAFMSFKKAERLDVEDKANHKPVKMLKSKTSIKNALKMCIRNVVWLSGVWDSKNFDQWLREFNPEVLVLQNSDSSFMLEIAYEISQRLNIPMVIFNTEGYSLFSKNWLGKYYGDWLFFPILKRYYLKSFTKVINRAESSIYLNGALMEDYYRKYAKKSSVIYTSSEVKFAPKEKLSNPPVFSYLGNFGYNRYKTIIEFANMLKTISSDYYLNVYGNPDPIVAQEFDKCKAITFHGLIPYESVKKVISNSDFLLHAETQDPYWRESLKYGFSTKIADTISSGNILILYAPNDIACSRYLIENGAGIHSDNANVLKEKLIEAINTPGVIDNIRETAKKVADINHNAQSNQLLFLAHLNEAILSYRNK